MQTMTTFEQLYQRTKSGDILSSSSTDGASSRSHKRAVAELLGGSPTDLMHVTNSSGSPQRLRILESLKGWAARQRILIEVCETVSLTFDGETLSLVVLTDNRGKRSWRKFKSDPIEAIAEIARNRGKKLWLVPSGEICETATRVAASNYRQLPIDVAEFLDQAIAPAGYQPREDSPLLFDPGVGHSPDPASQRNSYLKELESESIAIFREAVASGKNTCMLFSMGKDSMVMLRLAQKAFAPNPIPFPLVVIDTRWKFQEMYRFRDFIEAEPSLQMIVYTNPEAIERDVNPFDFGSGPHTQITKTEALRQVLDQNGFEIIFGGGRRDEEKSRAKERIFSVRGLGHTWNPREQRPELWNISNTLLVENQTLRVFPISNWTEEDIWKYIEQEQIPLVPLYFAKRRPVVLRNGSILAVDDERIQIFPNEQIEFEWVRFRTLGCYPLTGATYSMSLTLPEIVRELDESDTSERISRVIDFDAGASMEQKKREGYF